MESSPFVWESPCFHGKIGPTNGYIKVFRMGFSAEKICSQGAFWWLSITLVRQSPRASLNGLPERRPQFDPVCSQTGAAPPRGAHELSGFQKNPLADNSFSFSLQYVGDDHTPSYKIHGNPTISRLLLAKTTI